MVLNYVIAWFLNCVGGCIYRATGEIHMTHDPTILNQREWGCVGYLDPTILSKGEWGYIGAISINYY
jgi:hypothetical protein